MRVSQYSVLKKFPDKVALKRVVLKCCFNGPTKLLKLNFSAKMARFKTISTRKYFKTTAAKPVELHQKNVGQY